MNEEMLQNNWETLHFQCKQTTPEISELKNALKYWSGEVSKDKAKVNYQTLSLPQIPELKTFVQ